MKIDISSTILEIKSDAQVSIEDNDITKIIWHDENPTNITNAQILAKQIELQTDYDAKQYQRDRAKEYPLMADQLDDIFHNGIDSWKASIQIIKDKYPKE
tara:strand:- start:305 stop:604 length:300 start_codon:yes stop_codon:yes gene_type:complete